MGTLIIQIHQQNTAEKKSAMLEYHIEFNNSYNSVDFIEKVLDIKALASTWEGVKEPSNEYIAEYTDITELSKKINAQSDITEIIRDNKIDILNTYATGEELKTTIKEPKSINFQDFVDGVNRLIDNADKNND